jgi:hypothetical protein
VAQKKVLNHVQAGLQFVKILGSSPVYHQLVFEVRFDQGMVYLDRCGATVNRIIATDKNWVVKNQGGAGINPQAAPLVNLANGTEFSFNTEHYTFSLTQPVAKEAALTKEDIASFTAEVDAISRIVHVELDLREFRREGFRIWYLFATETEEASENWISSLKAFTIGPQVTAAFKGKLESQSHVLVVATENRKLRISINAVERTENLDLGVQQLNVIPRRLPKQQREAILDILRAKRRVLANPNYGVMVDIDAYIEDPIEIAPADFIEESLRILEEHLPKALSGGS